MQVGTRTKDKSMTLGSGFGSVGRAGASNDRGPGISKLLYWIFNCLLSTVLKRRK